MTHSLWRSVFPFRQSEAYIDEVSIIEETGDVSGRIGTAFVLGAGLGTRLRPLTLVRPKPLLPIFGKPLITFALDHLRAVGVESFVINTHHRPARRSCSGTRAMPAAE